MLQDEIAPRANFPSPAYQPMRRCCVCVTVYALKGLNMMQELCPPKPKELDRATFTSSFCCSLATMRSMSTASSGSWMLILGCRRPVHSNSFPSDDQDMQPLLCNNLFILKESSLLLCISALASQDQASLPVIPGFEHGIG